MSDAIVKTVEEEKRERTQHDTAKLTQPRPNTAAPMRGGTTRKQANSKHWFTTSFLQGLGLGLGAGKRCSECGKQGANDDKWNKVLGEIKM